LLRTNMDIRAHPDSLADRPRRAVMAPSLLVAPSFISSFYLADLGGEAIDIDVLSLCFQFDFDVGVIR
jgi:hypothetical protein